jgi:hypothetical protein
MNMKGSNMLDERRRDAQSWVSGREAGLLESTLLVNGFDFERLGNGQYVLQFHGSDGQTTCAVRLTSGQVKEFSGLIEVVLEVHEKQFAAN